MTTDIREVIKTALARFDTSALLPAASSLFELLGYKSTRRIDLPDTGAYTFQQSYDQQGQLSAAAQLERWRSVEMLFQITRDDLLATQQSSLFAKSFEPQTYHAFLFYAIDLKDKDNGSSYSRSELATITRELNRLFLMPVSVLFRFADAQGNRQLSLAIVTHRPNKRDEQRDVLEKVSLIHAISPSQPHRAHLEILQDLSLEHLRDRYDLRNFEDLQRAWARTLDTSELNKRFYRELSDWYFAAHTYVVFPEGAGDQNTRNATSLIRLITRIMFVWFLREKKLVPDDLFQTNRLNTILHDLSDDSSSYYKAILQNLFFATLNTEMNDPKHPRQFRSKNTSGGMDGHVGISSVYRYADQFIDPKQALELFAHIPFLNGGLFECLDPIDGRSAESLVDGFSERKDNPLHVPNKLFFGLAASNDDDTALQVDLNDVYGTRGRHYKIHGLIRIFERYKFTIDENTPIEEEVALDPELLGHVFENLLAAYNPETKLTARKETGSFYTPRNVVDYMVDESLLLLFAQKLGRNDDQTQQALRELLSFNQNIAATELFNPTDISNLVDAIDQLKIIDPACGSGAFPMGVLQKLVHVLSKLDPQNRAWRDRQLERADAIQDEEASRVARQTIEEAFARNELGYGRKLFLIANCIYGVDVQPIAVQIAKLRFFIALLVDQRVDNQRDNRGIRPLPNLETHLVAANSLAVFPAQQMLPSSETLQDLEKQLRQVRTKHFSARSLATKRKHREEDQRLRNLIHKELQKSSYAPEQTKEMAQWDPYKQNEAAEFFDPQWMFGIKDGFNLVIANPPYVRQEQIKSKKAALKAAFPDVYSGTADLYVYFYALSVRLLAEQGVLTFISSNSYFNSSFAEKLRGYLNRMMTIHTVIDFGEAPVFKAVTEPTIVVMTKQAAPQGHQVLSLNWKQNLRPENLAQVVEEQAFLVEQKLLEPKTWQFITPSTKRLLDKIHNAGRPLGEYVGNRLYYGIKTGLNEAFIIDQVTRDRLIAAHPSSEELLKPMLRGKDIRRWHPKFEDKWLIFTRRGINIEAYPAITQYLTQYKDKLIPGKGRKAGSYQWYEIQDNIAYWREFERPKIIYQEINRTGIFSYDTNNLYCNNKIFIMPDQPLNYLAILNSNLARWYLHTYSGVPLGGFLALQSPLMKVLPIVNSSASTLSNLTQQIIDSKQADPQADVSAWEGEINQRVYALYGLRSDEIRMIEEFVGEQQSNGYTTAADGDEE